MDQNWVIALLRKSAVPCEKDSSFLSVLQLLRIVFIFMDKLLAEELQRRDGIQ